jgi:hypothetical protein
LTRTERRRADILSRIAAFNPVFVGFVRYGALFATSLARGQSDAGRRVSAANWPHSILKGEP